MSNATLSKQEIETIGRQLDSFGCGLRYLTESTYLADDGVTRLEFYWDRGVMRDVKYCLEYAGMC